MKIVLSKVMEIGFQFWKVKIWRLPLSDILTHKLTYDGILQLIKLFIRKIVHLLITLKVKEFV
jgi:hypothetical protein